MPVFEYVIIGSEGRHVEYFLVNLIKDNYSVKLPLINNRGILNSQDERFVHLVTHI